MRLLQTMRTTHQERLEDLRMVAYIIVGAPIFLAIWVVIVFLLAVMWVEERVKGLFR